MTKYDKETFALLVGSILLFAAIIAILIYFSPVRTTTCSTDLPSLTAPFFPGMDMPISTDRGMAETPNPEPDEVAIRTDRVLSL